MSIHNSCYVSNNQCTTTFQSHGEYLTDEEMELKIGLQRVFFEIFAPGGKGQVCYQTAGTLENTWLLRIQKMLI